MKRFLQSVLLLTAVCILLPAVGCGSVVPPGKKVILLHPSGENEVVDRGVYKTWGRTRAYFVDQKLRSFTESMKILCADDVNMNVDIKTVLAFDASADHLEFIKQRVPATDNASLGGKELNLEKFYSMAVKDVLRGTCRNEISTRTTDDIRPNRQDIESAIHIAFIQRIKDLDYPLHVSAVLLSNIDYPKSVTESRERIKQAQLLDQEKAALAEATLAQKQRQVPIEQEDAKVRLVRARAQADENTILTGSLTPEFLMWRQLEVMETTARALAEGNSNTVFMMPYQTMNQDQ